jgi:hypothetical protein
LHVVFNVQVYKSMIYPRLELAVFDQHMEFATHDYTQQILRTCWLRSDLTGTHAWAFSWII